MVFFLRCCAKFPRTGQQRKEALHELDGSSGAGVSGSTARYNTQGTQSTEGTQGAQGTQGLVDQAQEKASEVVDQAQSKLGEVTDKAKQQVSQRLSGQIDVASESIGSVAQAVHAVGRQLRDEDQPAARWLRGSSR